MLKYTENKVTTLVNLLKIDLRVKFTKKVCLEPKKTVYWALLNYVIRKSVLRKQNACHLKTDIITMSFLF